MKVTRKQKKSAPTITKTWARKYKIKNDYGKENGTRKIIKPLLTSMT